MDLTEAFAPGPGGGGGGGGVGGGVRSGSDDLVKTDFFDFVVSPPPHCVNADGISDEEGFLQRDTCRGISFLHEPRSHEDHERRDHPHASGFIKETNNNTLTALPPVSTITGSLTRNSHGCVTVQGAEHISMDQSDCDYWSTEDSKEQDCSILLEDLNKYCWSTQANQPDNGSLSRSGDDRQNTDGAIYTLTVLNNEANSMDALDCCKSPTAQSTDSWSLRPSLDIDAILSMDTSNEHDRIAVESSADAFRPMPLSAARYTPEQVGNFAESKDISATRRRSIGDNNNDWKLSDRNRLQEATVGDSAAESLLRSALQGKLYQGPAQVVSSPSSSSSSSSTASSSSSATAATMPVNSIAGASTLQIIADQARGAVAQAQDEHMQACTEEELILSSLDHATYRPSDFEKIKCIANEVVESYCNLEPVCNVTTSATTVMYTLDPTSGSLGTITLAAELAPVGTVTVVTTSPPENAIQQQQQQQQPQSQQTQNSIDVGEQRQPATNSSGRCQQIGSSRPAKAAKKYCRRGNKAAANAASGSGAAGATGTAASQQQSAGSPGGATSTGTAAAPRKERSLHYCSICSKGFKDKYSVNVHIRTHTGEKPFACSLCGKSFRQKAHLAKHYQTHVAQKPNVSSTTNAGNSNGASPPAEAAAAPSRPASQAAAAQQSVAVNEANICNPAS